MFVIKSLLGTGTLVQTSGSIRLDGQPIGHNIDACVDYLSMNAEVYATLQDILSKSLNEE